MSKVKAMIIISIIIISLYLIRTSVVCYSIMNEIKYRTGHFVHGIFYDHNFVFRDFEDISDYVINYKIIFCFPVIGINKGIIFYKEEFTSYKNGELICGTWDKWLYGKPNKVYIERVEKKWKMVNIISHH